MLPPERERVFPKLRSEGYMVTSPETQKYNCVAWSAERDMDRWWQPGNEAGFYWPSGLPEDLSFESFLQVFESKGYKSCSNSDLEIFYEKVALYQGDEGGFMHVASQLSSGAWTSKLGSWEDIEHKSLGGLEGYYGRVGRIMKRPCALGDVLARAYFRLKAVLQSRS